MINMQSTHTLIDIKGIGQRFLAFLKTEKKSINGASKELNMHPSQVYNIVKGKNYGVAYFIQILTHYRHLNPLWLLEGRGEMLIDVEAAVMDVSSIPIYDLAATAGRDLSFLDDPENIKEYINPGSSFKDCHAAIRIYGDSMYPMYQSGDLIIVKKLRRPSYIHWGHVYLLITPEDRLLKHVHKGDDDSIYLLKSHNESYEPFELPRKDVLRIFEVHGYIRKLKF